MTETGAVQGFLNLSTINHSCALSGEGFLTSIHQQVALLCFLLVPLVIGEQDHPEPIFTRLRHLQVLAVPFCCHTDCAVITVIGTLPWFTFNECLSGRLQIMC